MIKLGKLNKANDKARVSFAVVGAVLGFMLVTNAQADSCAANCTRVWGSTAKKNCEMSYQNCKDAFIEKVDLAISEINSCEADDTNCKIEKISKACQLKNEYNICKLRVKASFPLSIVPQH